jgi:hypothetical protein
MPKFPQYGWRFSDRENQIYAAAYEMGRFSWKKGMDPENQISNGITTY